MEKLNNNDLWIFWNKKKKKYKYFESSKTTAEAIYNIVGLYAEKTDRIMELGCGNMKNLQHLYDKGFQNLTALEYSHIEDGTAKKELKEVYEKIVKSMFPIEIAIPRFKDKMFDITLCVGILGHLPDIEDELAKHIRRITKKYVIVFENETEETPIHWARNYQGIFEQYKMKQVYTSTELIEGLTCRVFQRL
jgi:ubiquinone/menaquinone biosynthesis C-methylase UbiE